MCLYLIRHVKRCQDKNVTCHRNTSPSYQQRNGTLPVTKLNGITHGNMRVVKLWEFRTCVTIIFKLKYYNQ